MTKKQKTIAASLAVISLIAAVGYIQVVKAMNYVLTYKKFIVNDMTLNKISLDLYFNLQNKSSLKYRISKIKTDIYVNGIFVSKANNFSEQTIDPRTTSPVAVAIVIKPKEVAKKLERDWAALLLFPEKINIKMVMNLRIKYGILSFTIPYTHTMSLKELIKNV